VAEGVFDSFTCRASRQGSRAVGIASSHRPGSPAGQAGRGLLSSELDHPSCFRRSYEAEGFARAGNRTFYECC
jgi:hypothetical protein